MAALTEQERADLWAQWQRDMSNSRQTLALTKAELRAAIDGLDDYIESTQGAINSAIPQPARGALTATQKAELLMFVVAKRFKVI